MFYILYAKPESSHPGSVIYKLKVNNNVVVTDSYDYIWVDSSSVGKAKTIYLNGKMKVKKGDIIRVTRSGTAVHYHAVSVVLIYPK